jgi:hypothetical protein
MQRRSLSLPPLFVGSKIGPVDGHQAVIAYVAYFLILKVNLGRGKGGREDV